MHEEEKFTPCEKSQGGPLLLTSDWGLKMDFGKQTKALY